MGNFDFLKVWWGGYRWGGAIAPLAPMVATALVMNKITYAAVQDYWA